MPTPGDGQDVVAGWNDPPARSKRTHVKPAAIRQLLIELFGFKNPDDVEKGKCRVCLEPVAGGRRFYCSDEHARDFQRIGFWTIQDAIYFRDKGVCQCCRLNEAATIAEYVEAGAAPTMLSHKITAAKDRIARLEVDRARLDKQIAEARDEIAKQAALEAILEAWRAPSDRTTLFEVDHKKPVEGWTGDPVEANHPDNLQLLCIPCHRKKSAAEAGSRAKARRHRAKEGPKARHLRETRESNHAAIKTPK